MNKVSIKEEKLIGEIKSLSSKRKKEVADYVAFLKIKDEMDATKKTLNDKNIMKSILKGEEDFKK